MSPRSARAAVSPWVCATLRGAAPGDSSRTTSRLAAADDDDPLGVPPGAPVSLASLRALPAFARARAAYDALVEGVPFRLGQLASAAARADAGEAEDALSSLVYGETDFDTIALALARVAHVHGGRLAGATFVDVGAGVGKPVFAAALLARGLREARGVELLPELLAIAEGELLGAWAAGLPAPLGRGQREPALRVPPAARAVAVRFALGDAAAPGGGEEGEDWTDADVAFACSTCFDDATWARLAALGRRMRPGAFFVSSGGCFELDDGAWALRDELEGAAFSWGPGKLYILQRA